jgi:hypothetical protein
VSRYIHRGISGLLVPPDGNCRTDHVTAGQFSVTAFFEFSTTGVGRGRRFAAR